MSRAPGRPFAADGAATIRDAPADVDRTIVGVADMKVIRDPGQRLVTYALGSCIGVTVWDRDTRVGGLLHVLLPSARSNPEKGEASPAMFADTGVPALFRAAYELGAKKERLVVCAAGGAEVLSGNGHFRIGHRNRTILRKIFWKAGVIIDAEDCGGNDSRTLSLSLADGTVSITSRGTEQSLWTA